MYLAVAVLAIILASGAFSDSSSDGPEYTQVGQDCVQYVGFASHLELNLIGIDHQEWRQAWYDAMYQCENLMQFTAAVMMNQWHPGFYYVDAVCTEWFPGDDDPFVRRMCEDFARLCAIPGEREVTHVCREHFDTGLLSSFTPSTSDTAKMTSLDVGSTASCMTTWGSAQSFSVPGCPTANSSINLADLNNGSARKVRDGQHGRSFVGHGRGLRRGEHLKTTQRLPQTNRRVARLTRSTRPEVRASRPVVGDKQRPTDVLKRVSKVWQ